MPQVMSYQHHVVVAQRNEEAVLSMRDIQAMAMRALTNPPASGLQLNWAELFEASGGGSKSVMLLQIDSSESWILRR